MAKNRRTPYQDKLYQELVSRFGAPEYRSYQPPCKSGKPRGKHPAGTLRLKWIGIAYASQSDQADEEVEFRRVLKWTKQHPGVEVVAGKGQTRGFAVYIPPEPKVPTDEDLFLAKIAEMPWDDELVRGVYADWLDEQGREDEATRQRQYVPALKVLMRYADPQGPLGYLQDEDFWNHPDRLEDDDGFYKRWREELREEVKTHVVNIKRVMAIINYWAESVRSGGPSTGPTEALQNPEKRKAFWQAMQVVTGVDAPETLRSQSYYSCAC